MKNLIISSLLGLILLTSCSEEIEQTSEYPNAENLIWHYSLDESNEWRSVYDPIIYEDIVILPRINAYFKQGELIALNKKTGKLIWKWSEAWDKYNKSGFSIDSYVYDGILAIGDNNYIAAINIYTGETLWENLDTLHCQAAIRGSNETIFKSSFIPTEHYWIQKGNIYTGEWETIYELKKEGDYKVNSNVPTPIEWNGKTYLTFLKVNWRNDQGVHDTNNFLYLYNITEDRLEWKSDTIQLEYPNSGTPGVLPTFDDGQILLSNDAFYSYNIEDGSLEWRKFYGGRFTLTSRITAANGKVYGNNGANYFVGLDVHTGEELFRTDTGGSPSRVVYNDDKCYLASVTKPTGGNYFMVIDGTTGNVIHDYKESENLGDGIYLDWGLTVDPETGYAYTSDHYNALCLNFE